MKQVEKLDLVLKALHELPSKSGDIEELLNKKGVTVTHSDACTIGYRLESAGYIEFSPSKNSANADLTSEGIEFVEGDSFTHKGQSVINNYISNSPNANLVNQSSNVLISQHNTSEIKQVLERIKGAVNSDQSIDSLKRQEVLECVEEIEHSVNSGRKPKFAIKSLIEIAADVSSIIGMATQLATLIPAA